MQKLLYLKNFKFHGSASDPCQKIVLLTVVLKMEIYLKLEIQTEPLMILFVADIEWHKKILLDWKFKHNLGYEKIVSNPFTYSNIRRKERRRKKKLQ